MTHHGKLIHARLLGAVFGFRGAAQTLLFRQLANVGIGIAQGYATLGAIGFEGRWDYAAIGNVTNLAARLCAEAAGGQILADRKTMAKVESIVEASAAGPFALKGFAQPVAAIAKEAM